MIGSNEARRWRVDTSARDNPDAVRALEDELGLYRLTASLLYSRGYRTPEAATAFLRRDDECFHDPLLLPDMDKAVERVTAAINSGERVMIYGDYDVDGVTSVATLFLYLRSKGVPVDYYIPERTSEGYGMNEGAVRRIAAGGTSLIITVDTGITAVEEIALASSLGNRYGRDRPSRMSRRAAAGDSSGQSAPPGFGVPVCGACGGSEWHSSSYALSSSCLYRTTTAICTACVRNMPILSRSERSRT